MVTVYTQTTSARRRVGTQEDRTRRWLGWRRGGRLADALPRCPPTCAFVGSATERLLSSSSWRISSSCIVSSSVAIAPPPGPDSTADPRAPSLRALYVELAGATAADFLTREGVSLSVWSRPCECGRGKGKSVSALTVSTPERNRFEISSGEKLSPATSRGVAVKLPLGNLTTRFTFQGRSSRARQGRALARRPQQTSRTARTP